MTKLEKTLVAVTGATLDEVRQFIKWESTPDPYYGGLQDTLMPSRASFVTNGFGEIIDLALNDVPVMKYLMAK